MKDFIAAVRDEDEDEVVEEGTTFKHWDTDVTFFQPSEDQFLMMLAMGGRTMNTKQIGNFIHLFIELGDDSTQRYFQDLLMDRKSGFTVTGEGGLFDIWEELVEEWSGKDSEKQSDSPAPRRATGRASTAPTRAKASGSSRSRSTAS